jgi:hypothetical protein
VELLGAAHHVANYDGFQDSTGMIAIRCCTAALQRIDVVIGIAIA